MSVMSSSDPPNPLAQPQASLCSTVGALLASAPALAPAALRLPAFDALASCLRSRGDYIDELLDAAASVAAVLITAATSASLHEEDDRDDVLLSCVSSGLPVELVTAGSVLRVQTCGRVHISLLSALVRAPCLSLTVVAPRRPPPRHSRKNVVAPPD